MQTPVFNLSQGHVPLLVSFPHLGTVVPDEVRPTLSPVAATLRDTDWHLDSLYAFAGEMGASLLCAKVSRYVIDLNRPPGGESLYPGQNTTGLCPTETFRGEALYLDGHQPDAAETQRRREIYWQPYHDVLRTELDRLRALHGHVLLWEAHSIATVLPRLFAGALPDLNFGTNDGRACATEITEAALHAARRSKDRLTQILDGRFKGGYITRHYGQPESGIHAIQLEMCQHLYMNEDAPFEYLPEKAARLQSVLIPMLADALAALRARPAAPHG